MSGTEGIGGKAPPSHKIGPNVQEPEAGVKPDELVDALLSEVTKELNARDAARKPLDPHLRALQSSLFNVSSAMASDMYKGHTWDLHDVISKLWESLPKQELRNGSKSLEAGVDPFFRDAERYYNDVDLYKSASSEIASQDFAADWMETYRVNMEIDASQSMQGEQPIQGSGKLEKLMADNDYGVDSHPERLTDKEYKEYMSDKLERDRRNAILEGRTDRPKWEAYYTPKQIENIRKLNQHEEKKRREYEDKQRKKLQEEYDKEAKLEEWRKKKEVERKVALEIARKAKEKVVEKAKYKKHWQPLRPL